MLVVPRRKSLFMGANDRDAGRQVAFATNLGLPDGTLAAVKRLLRYAILIPGVLYVWALLPISFRPQYTGSPLRKSDQTLSVDVVGGALDAAPVAQTVTAAAALGLQQMSSSRIKRACQPPALLKPVVRPAQQVTVRYVDNGRVVAETKYDCKKYN